MVQILTRRARAIDLAEMQMTNASTVEDSRRWYTDPCLYGRVARLPFYYQRPCGRLDWILGLDAEAPDSRITALFTPMLYCLEPDGRSDNGVYAIEGRARASERVERSCKLSYLAQLQLGHHYVYDQSLQHQLSRPLRSEKAEHHWRRATLLPEKGSFYVAGSRYDLPARLYEAARLHAPVPDGVSFYAFSTPDDQGTLTVLLPCSEIARSCYSQWFAHGLAAIHEDSRRGSGVAMNGQQAHRRNQNEGAAPIIDEDYVRAMSRLDPDKLLARALVFGTKGQPRPILIRPPHTGSMIIGGRGYSYHDERGDVLFIVSDLFIKSSFAEALEERRNQHFQHGVGCMATFAPVFSDSSVMLGEIRASAPHGCSDTLSAYDVRHFKLQLNYFDEFLADLARRHDPKVLPDLRKWAEDYYFWRLPRFEGHSVALSASFLEYQGRHQRQTATRQCSRRREDT